VIESWLSTDKSDGKTAAQLARLRANAPQRLVGHDRAYWRKLSRMTIATTSLDCAPARNVSNRSTPTTKLRLYTGTVTIRSRGSQERVKKKKIISFLIRNAKRFDDRHVKLKNGEKFGTRGPLWSEVPKHGALALVGPCGLLRWYTDLFLRESVHVVRMLIRWFSIAINFFPAYSVLRIESYSDRWESIVS